MVNIHDFQDDEMPEDIWVEIFKKQKLLADKYKDIEKMGTLLETTKLNVDTAVGQRFIKDFAWRVTEELTEAIEARVESNAQAEVGEDGLRDEAYLHFQEELIDALHFLTELTIIAGYDETIIPVFFEINENEDWHLVVYYLGLMCNCLKNKPWKQTQMLTDREKFENYLKNTWEAMIFTMRKSGMDLEAIYQMYFKKNMVNRFRQRSKY